MVNIAGDYIINRVVGISLAAALCFGAGGNTGSNVMQEKHSLRGRSDVSILEGECPIPKSLEEISEEVFYKRINNAYDTSTQTCYSDESLGFMGWRDYNPGDVEWMARTIFGEARGTNQESMAAVGGTIINRAYSNLWPNTIKRVVLQPFQYSIYNEGDPNKDLVHMDTSLMSNSDLQEIQLSRYVAELVLLDAINNPCPYATSYRDSNFRDYKDFVSKKKDVICKIDTGKKGIGGAAEFAFVRD